MKGSICSSNLEPYIRSGTAPNTALAGLKKVRMGEAYNNVRTRIKMCAAGYSSTKASDLQKVAYNYTDFNRDFYSLKRKEVFQEPCGL